MDEGINFFDTAETYGNGKAEELLGNALKPYKREDYVIVSKVAPWNLRSHNIVKAVDGSLRRLGINYIDLYLIHYPNPLIRFQETFRTLEYLVKKGKIRYIGVSNFCSYLLERAQENLTSCEIIANEIEYNLLSRRAEQQIIPYCKKHSIEIISYSPLAGEILTGKYDAKRLAKDRARAFNFVNRQSLLKKATPLFEFLGNLSEERGVSIAQLALAYIINKGFTPIPAALTEDQVAANAEAPNIILNADEMDRITKLCTGVNLPTYLFDHLAIRPLSWIKCSLVNLLKT